jgi:hypothetical protein
MGTKLEFSSAYQPLKHGKTKVMNHSLGNLLHNIVGEKPKQWDLDLPQVKFSYNILLNRSTGKSPL